MGREMQAWKIWKASMEDLCIMDYFWNAPRHLESPLEKSLASKQDGPGRCTTQALCGTLCWFWYSKNIYYQHREHKDKCHQYPLLVRRPRLPAAAVYRYAVHMLPWFPQEAGQLANNIWMWSWASESKRVLRVQETNCVKNPSLILRRHIPGARIWQTLYGRILRDMSRFLNISRVPGFQVLNKQADVSDQPS